MICGADDSDELSKEHAPYVDEETAHVERMKNMRNESKRKDKRIKRLSDEVESLESEVDELSKELKATKSRLERKEKEVGESGGNAAVNTSDNKHSGNSVSDGKVSGGEGQTFNTSYYGMDCAGCTGITASGLDVSGGKTHYNGMRILAADTSILPLHTVVKVTNPDGSSYTGIVKDRGGAIKGRKLDVLVGSEAESKKHGRHDAKVEVIKRGDNSYRRE